jgi:hypothetical protein
MTTTTSHSEANLQKACYKLFCKLKPREYGLLYLNHNNAANAIQGAILKGMGMVAGVADMTYLTNPVTFLEFKVAKGRQSEAQKNWQQLVESHGYRYIIVRSQAEFCKAVGIELAGV